MSVTAFLRHACAEITVRGSILRAFISLMLFLTGCAQTVTLQTLRQTETVPKVAYVGYAFSAGELERLRVVFLKAASARVDVEASSDSVQILPMTFEQAVGFVRRNEPPQTLDIQTVRHRGEIIGYLLTYVPPAVVRRVDEWLEVSLYERGGKIQFVVDRRFRADG